MLLLDTELTEAERYPKGDDGYKIGSVKRMAQIGPVRESNALLMSRISRANSRMHIGRGEGTHHRRLLWIDVCVGALLGRLPLWPKELASLVRNGLLQPYLPVDGTVLDGVYYEAGDNDTDDDFHCVYYEKS
jgi:hypothetical protein